MVNILDILLGPLMSLNPTLSLAILSLIISAIVTIAYKYLTDQTLMKQLKDDLKRLQKEMKENRSDTKRVLGLQKEAMEKNMTYMSHSLKPSLITLLPIIFIFGWMNANFAFHPLDANTDFTVNAFTKVDGPINMYSVPADLNITALQNETTGKNATWIVNGTAGEYVLKFNFTDQVTEQKVIIGAKYENPDTRHSGNISKIIISNKPMKVNLLGLEMGWIWAYIIFSMIFSTLIRKLFKIH
jgi:uncharacterized membrane protein (DUF106 family)